MKHRSNAKFYVYGVTRNGKYPSLKSMYKSTNNIGYFDSSINKWSANFIGPIIYCQNNMSQNVQHNS